MLWFNEKIFTGNFSFEGISIHLMLWFNFSHVPIKHVNVGFQYILCYGSTENKISGIPLPEPFQYILCYGSTIAGM